MAQGKDAYLQYCPPQAPLFHQPWWLEAVCGDSWSAATVIEHNEMRAYYLFAERQTVLGKFLTMPPLTQFLGPAYHIDAPNEREWLNQEIDLLQKLIAQLPAHAFFESRWHYRYRNWLPFYWQGYQQRTRYTYVLEPLNSAQALFARFSEKVRREIEKAQRLFHVEEAASVDPLWHLVHDMFRRKKMSMPFSRHLATQLYVACRRYDAGRIWQAFASDGRLAAVLFVAWDQRTAYYIIGARDPAFGNSGAMSYLFWHALQYLEGRVAAFDFEGSMLPGVASFFRSFGAVPKDFFELTQTRSLLLRAKEAIRLLIGRR